MHLSVLQSRPLTLRGSDSRSRRSFAEMMRVVHHGRLRGIVSRTFALADIVEAHKAIAGRDVFGKLVLRVP
jgi:NADPH:quinone reductase-like Zn-dependent oxidoreductase